MGLAQRFKDKLDRKNIFEKTQLEKDFENQDIKFISKPITESITVQPKELHSTIIEPVKNITDLTCDEQKIPPACSLKFEELETEIINKIRKTPYWEDFSIERQANMINLYFEKRCECEFTAEEKAEFVENILALANAK